MPLLVLIQSKTATYIVKLCHLLAKCGYLLEFYNFKIDCSKKWSFNLPYEQRGERFDTKQGNSKIMIRSGSKIVKADELRLYVHPINDHIIIDVHLSLNNQLTLIQFPLLSLTNS